MWNVRARWLDQLPALPVLGRTVKLRRVALWSVVVAEYVLIALIVVLHVGQ
jgi:hypothetical protein